MEMALSESYLVPKINGWNYYNKPPMFNWVMILFFKLFGSFEEWVVRFPSLLAFLATAVINFLIVKRFLKTQVALLSSLFFLTSSDLLFYGTVNAGEIDLFFSFLVYLQVMAIFWFFEKRQFGRLFLISYLLAAAGTLTKGPPSIAFQGLTLLPWLIVNREWKWLFSWKHFLGIFAYVIVVGGYFYWYSLNDDVIPFLVRLFKEASQRTGLEHTFLDTLLGTASFPFMLFKLLAPWSILLVFLFRKDVFNVIRTNPLLRFCGVFILFNIPLYWISSDHRARYIYMFFPFFCILLSFFFLNTNNALQKWKSYIFRLFWGVMIFVTLAFLAPPFIPQTSELPYIILKCAMLILLGTTMIYAFQKYPEYKIYLFILFIFLVRIGFNFTYLPAMAVESNQLIYRDHTENVLEITKEEPVHWFGIPYTYYSSGVSNGLFSVKDVKVTTASLMPYQIPYYITKGNQHILQFDTIFEPNQYYLARTDVLDLKDKQVKVLYKFPDKWMNKEIVLFKTNVEREN
jgi:4-amino-4-deoxy-L-arabinose transferase-like glycosyltransferase